MQMFRLVKSVKYISSEVRLTNTNKYNTHLLFNFLLRVITIAIRD